MTERQRIFYFQKWNACCRTNGWRMERGRLTSGLRHPTSDELALVRQWAEQLARDDHSAVTLDHLRYAVHLVATGKAVSSSKLNNRQIDRVFALLDLLAEPDNLTFVIAWMNPETKNENWLREFIAAHFHDDYVNTLCQRMHRGHPLDQLPKPELVSLLRTLKDRPNARKQTVEEPF